VGVYQRGPLLLAQGAMALVLAYLCAVAQTSSSPPLRGVQVMECPHDGVVNGGASQGAGNPSAASAFSFL